MGVITRKAHIRELLADRNYEDLLAWAVSVRSPQRVLFSLALDPDEMIAWRAIEGIGRVAGVEAQGNIERIRDMVRRLLWLMNDESGGLGWRSPEMIGEILVNVPELIDEYGKLLTAYLREEPFEKGTHLAVSRIASVNPEPFIGSVQELRKSLKNADAAIRCHAASALWAIDKTSNRPFIEPLRGDSAQVTVYDYDTGMPVETTVGRLITSLMKSTGASDTRRSFHIPA